MRGRHCRPRPPTPSTPNASSRALRHRAEPPRPVGLSHLPCFPTILSQAWRVHARPILKVRSTFMHSCPAGGDGLVCPRFVVRGSLRCAFIHGHYAARREAMLPSDGGRCRWRSSLMADYLPSGLYVRGAVSFGGEFASGVARSLVTQLVVARVPPFSTSGPPSSHGYATLISRARSELRRALYILDS